MINSPYNYTKAIIIYNIDLSFKKMLPNRPMRDRIDHLKRNGLLKKIKFE
jgi:hypothetical protein